MLDLYFQHIRLHFTMTVPQKIITEYKPINEYPNLSRFNLMQFYLQNLPELVTEFSYTEGTLMKIFHRMQFRLDLIG